MSNPKVFFDITINYMAIGRIVLQLYADTTPKTAENFRCLCTGETYNVHGERLTFKHTVFHNIIPNILCQGGLEWRRSRRENLKESIYGEKFDDENFVKKHDGPGILSMANKGKNTNGTQFYLCFGCLAILGWTSRCFRQSGGGDECTGGYGECRSLLGYVKKEVVIEDCGQLS